MAEGEEEDNPLAFLDRLLPEERHSNLHFGDVRFWQHLEYVDTNQIFNTKSLEYRTMKLAFCEALFYIMFLTVLTGYIVQVRSSDLFDSRRQQLDYFAGCSGAGAQRSCTIDGVKDGASMMTWLQKDFIPKTFTDRGSYPSVVMSTSIFRLQEGTMAWTPRYDGDTNTSVIVGSIRIRQLRVQYNKDCNIQESLRVIQPDCFPQFSAAVQSRLSWAPLMVPVELQGFFKWHPANVTQQTTMVGYHGTYPGDGFFLDLPLNMSAAQHRLVDLAGWQWIDQRTRAVVVELSTFSPNVDIFVHNRILFEMPATGGITVRQEASAFRALQLSLALMANDDFNGSFAYMFVTCAMHLILLVYSCFLIYKNGLRFFTYFWSIVDIIILLLFFILVGVTTYIFLVASFEPNFKPEVMGDPEMFFPIGTLVPALEMSANVLALLGLAAWFKILKYFSLASMLHPFVRVIERCICNLILFVGLLFVVLFGFAVAIHIGYGGEDDVFSTVGGAFVAVVAAPAGGVSLAPIFAKDDLLGPVLVFLYVIIVLLLLLRTFMAICIDTYTVSTYEINAVHRTGRSSAPAVFLWTYYNALKGVKLVGKETEENIGAPEEQEVPLTSLPEAIANQFLATKRRMEELLESAEADMEAAKQDKIRQAGGLPSDRWQAGLRSRLTGAGQGKPPQPALEDRQRPMALKDGRAESPAESIEGESPTTAQPQDLVGITVKRVQLQRMLDDDPVLREICSTSRAVDVVRRFRVDQSGIDPYEAVAQLQASVAKKLDEIEKNGMVLTFDEMETLRTVSQELHSALTESQKEWRSELLCVMQMASLLSSALVELTRKLEQVQLNHSSLAMRVGVVSK